MKFILPLVKDKNRLLPERTGLFSNVFSDIWMHFIPGKHTRENFYSLAYFKHDIFSPKSNFVAF